MAVVEANPNFPQPDRGPHEAFLHVLIAALARVLTQFATRLNDLLPVDGSERMTGPLLLASYMTSGRPAPSSANNGGLIYVSDASSGQHFQGSDGSTWHILG